MSRLKNITFKPLLDTLRLQKISDDEYFSEKYSEYISNSRLTKINPDQDGNIEKFIDGLQANRLFLPSLPLGSAVHEMVLQPEYFELITDITSKPSAKAGFIADELINICDKIDCPTDDEILKACQIVDYYGGNPTKAQFNKLKGQILPYLYDVNQFLQYDERSKKTPIFLDSKQLETAQFCIDALNKNKKVQSLLHPDCISENEQAILLDVEVNLPDVGTTIVRLKSKLDNYTIDKMSNTITINDIKTHGSTVDKFSDALIHFHYYREMAMYSYLLKLCCEKFYGMKNPKVESNFLVVSTVPQYYTKVVPMTKDLFKKGFKEFRWLLKLAAASLYFKDNNRTLLYLNDYDRF